MTPKIYKGSLLRIVQNREPEMMIHSADRASSLTALNQKDRLKEKNGSIGTVKL